MSATGWDRGAVYYADVLNEEQSISNHQITEQELLLKCQKFLDIFSINNSFYYRDQIRIASTNTIVIQLAHLQAFDDMLATSLVQTPGEILILLEKAASNLHKEIHKIETVVQVQIHSSGNPMSIRSLSSGYIGKLIRLSGIITSASTTIARPISVCIRCRDCRLERFIPVTSAFGGVQLPRQCPGQAEGTDNRYSAKCSWNSYQLEGDKCICVDQQTLKLQEIPEMVPVGELPRQVILIIDRAMCSNGTTPGQRVIINGIYTISNNKKNEDQASLRTPYIKVVGIQSINNDQVEEQVDGVDPIDWVAFSRQRDLYEKFAASIAPSIYGMDDVKKAITCLLFGGSRKRLPDNLRIRGDINILLLGDPGTAKSQFLKFTEKVAPISVYTSGKGSSAAGLTASVIRDPHSGEFYLEGGAMVLADGGVVCIDEFDKMDGDDRVAIHEAMEQQTISIAKAGITTILNSRTSVLAAANPKFGRYDDFKSTNENIEFGTTILSRFDMIFIVKDEHVREKDLSLAKHVLQVHQQQTQDSAGFFDLNVMKGYIKYCRQKCAPRLTAQAAQHLSIEYTKLRRSAVNGGGVPITVRQLEAVIRISEALAKMTLNTTAGITHVNEALRLFHASTVKAANQGHVIDGMARPELMEQVNTAEKAIKQRLPIGSSIAYARLVKELHTFPEQIITRAIEVLIQQEKLSFKGQRKILIRQR